MIKKKTTQTLLLVFSTFLLLVSVTVSAQRQRACRRDVVLGKIGMYITFELVYKQ